MKDRKARFSSLPRYSPLSRALPALSLGALLLVAPASGVWAMKKSLDIKGLTIEQAMTCVMEPRFDVKLGAAAEQPPGPGDGKAPKESHVFAITAKGKVLNGVRPQDSDEAYHWNYLDPIVRLDEDGNSNFIALNREKGDLTDFITSRIFIVSFSRDQVALANAKYFAGFEGGAASAAWNNCDKVTVTDGKMQLGGGGIWPFD